VIVTDVERNSGQAADGPTAAAIAFITTEHFTLQGARSATIAESIGRATMFLASVSGGLVALGLVATATGVGGAFFAFGLVLLPTLAFVGFVTFERAVQTSIEDVGYVRRIARLRAYYFDNAPELTQYLQSPQLEGRLFVQGLPRGEYLQTFRSVAGMIGVVTAVLAGSAVGLGVVAAWDAPGAALGSGCLVALLAVGVLTQYFRRTWARAESDSNSGDEASAS
jgi:hypothetical protein